MSTVGFIIFKLEDENPKTLLVKKSNRWTFPKFDTDINDPSIEQILEKFTDQTAISLLGITTNSLSDLKGINYHNESNLNYYIGITDQQSGSKLTEEYQEYEWVHRRKVQMLIRSNQQLDGFKKALQWMTNNNSSIEVLARNLTKLQQ